jgi:hypothetical protein
MGTSSSFKGPKNNSSLLPSWAVNPDDQSESATPEQGDGDYNTPTDNQNADPSAPADGSTDDTSDQDSPKIPNPDKKTKKVNWSNAKSAMSRFGGNSGNNTSLKKAGRNYVRARGGSQGATRAAGRGISAIANLGGFLGDIAQTGFDQALRNVGLQDCIGKSAEEVFARLADQLAPAGGPIDEGITRKAILDSLCYLYDLLTDENGDMQQVDALGPDEVKESLILATQYYIYQKWLNEVGITLERKNVSETELIEAETTVKDFVGESVRIAFQDVDISTFSLSNPSVIGQINSIFQETYDLIEQ